ncbi:hypothetical protein GGGNBK_02300 [Sporosarcina sp. ANT_H38]
MIKVTKGNVAEIKTSYYVLGGLLIGAILGLVFYVKDWL